MCPEGARLYLAWTALLPQIPTAAVDQVPPPKVSTPAVAAAREAYFAHCAACKKCHRSTENADQYLARFGLKQSDFPKFSD